MLSLLWFGGMVLSAPAAAAAAAVYPGRARLASSAHRGPGSRPIFDPFHPVFLISHSLRLCCSGEVWQLGLMWLWLRRWRKTSFRERKAAPQVRQAQGWGGGRD